MNTFTVYSLTAFEGPRKVRNFPMTTRQVPHSKPSQTGGTHQKKANIAVFSRTFAEIPYIQNSDYQIPVFSNVSRMCTNPVYKTKVMATSRMTKLKVELDD